MVLNGLAPAARSSPRSLASVPPHFLDNTLAKLFGKWFLHIIPLRTQHTPLLGNNFRQAPSFYHTLGALGPKPPAFSFRSREDVFLCFFRKFSVRSGQAGSAAEARLMSTEAEINARRTVSENAAEARLMSTEAEINARQTTADHSGRNFIISQPPAWAPNIDVETELSGEEDESEVIDFESAVKATAFSIDGRCLAAGCQDGFVRTIRIDAEDRNLALCMAQQPRLGCGRDGSGGSPLALLDGDLLRLVVSLIPATTLRLGGQVASALLPSGASALVSAVAFDEDGQELAAGTITGRILLFDYLSAQPRGVEIACVGGHSVMALVYVSRQLLASAGRDRVVRIWSTATAAEMLTLQGHTGMIHALSCHTHTATHTASGPAGGRGRGGGRALLASGSSDCTVRMWDLEWGEGVSRSGGGLHDSNHDVCDHQSNAAGESSERFGKVVWGSQHSEPLRGHYRGIHGVAFSPDGSLLAGSVNSWGYALVTVASGDCLISIWDTSGAIPHSRGEALKGHLSSVFCLAFSPNGKVLASAGDDRVVRLWCCATMQPIRQLRGHSRGVASVAFDPKGCVVASGSGDGTLRLWQFDTNI